NEADGIYRIEHQEGEGDANGTCGRDGVDREGGQDSESEKNARAGQNEFGRLFVSSEEIQPVPENPRRTGHVSFSGTHGTGSAMKRNYPASPYRPASNVTASGIRFIWDLKVF